MGPYHEAFEETIEYISEFHRKSKDEKDTGIQSIREKVSQVFKTSGNHTERSPLFALYETSEELLARWEETEIRRIDFERQKQIDLKTEKQSMVSKFIAMGALGISIVQVVVAFITKN